jgi:hypothetical protein
MTAFKDRFPVSIVYRLELITNIRLKQQGKSSGILRWVLEKL